MSLSPARAAALLAENVQRVIQGKPDVVRLATVALFAEGHLLLEDVPGTGKTSLARSLARSIGGRWSRIQFTPDLLPLGARLRAATRYRGLTRVRDTRV